ncbi:MAG: hypothetical protein QOG15_963 [Solirubrobacteraceae bacterium]|jgi:hypothetical protein|nr:hypothetical protein [Solirubrobacteraceae bacterium]
MGLRRSLLASILLAAVFVPAVKVTVAAASSTQESIMMDDDLLLYRGDHKRAQALTRMKQIGVDSVRVTVLWRYVAQGANLSNAEIKRLKSASAKAAARKQRAQFKPANPRTYPRRNWDKYDNLVKEAARLRMRVFFTVTGPGPTFGHRTAPPSQRANFFSFKPYPTRFREFVKAVGTRYSGTYRDENALKQPLPRVSLWSIWNEPNQPGWLSPQWEKRDGQIIPSSPGLYRALLREGIDALTATGHGGDTIMLGEMAPIGSNSRGPRNPIRPTPFLRELVCVNPAGVRYVGADATRRGCDFATKGPLKVTAFAHHAYTKKLAPTAPVGNPDDLTIANLGIWGPLLDNLARQSGAIPSGLPIYITEFGYESNPPDPLNGIPQLLQAQYNQLGDFLAFSNPRVRGITQFLLRDAAPLRRYKKNSRNYWFTYQSGIFTSKDKTKPATFAYLLPFVARAQPGNKVLLWGQLRFRPNDSNDIAVTQSRPNASAAWSNLGDPVPTSVLGYFSKVVPSQGPTAEYRAVYVTPGTNRIFASSLSAKP